MIVKVLFIVHEIRPAEHSTINAIATGNGANWAILLLLEEGLSIGSEMLLLLLPCK